MLVVAHSSWSGGTDRTPELQQDPPVPKHCAPSHGQIVAVGAGSQRGQRGQRGLGGRDLQEHQLQAQGHLSWSELSCCIPSAPGACPAPAPALLIPAAQTPQECNTPMETPPQSSPLLGGYPRLNPMGEHNPSPALSSWRPPGPSPTQFLPSGVISKPALQMHWKLPSVLTQRPFLHITPFMMHSSMSAGKSPGSESRGSGSSPSLISP